MGPTIFDNLSDGPAVVLPPQHPHPFPHFSHSSPMNINNPFSSKSSWKPAPSSSSSAPTLNPSRKRSRDDYSASIEDEPHDTTTVTAPPPAPPVEEEPIYGEGMVLLNPRSGMVISAESQTGTWYEEKAETTASSAPPIAVPTSSSSSNNQPDLPSRKSQRLDATASGWDDITAAAIQAKLQSSTHEDSYRPTKQASSSSLASSSFNSQEPHVDDFTHMLGISWQRVSRTDDDVAAAVRGWERYIQNHFADHIQEAEILLKHRGLTAYLVAGRPSATSSNTVFYLFSEDLTEARLVGNSWEACLRNLRSSPIEYESGSQVLRAAERTPERVVEDKGVLIGSVGVDGENGVVMGDAMGMDIDQ
ncbi:hypothetical protein AJ79_10023 [Helicocarpus griseus UAMH5409]|uniref:Uncharacterized protein n=1 Tax=Helicocarpus griseus UAMH5409 TaxID=1447875 RepID=A0A2B7W7L0_9EURO|nr:hypothetical protein AJ79_10023 [Helicocarpus griseus UAMH5409]